MTPLEALQQTLAGEHAAVYVYRALAGRVSTSADPDLATGLAAAYTVHRGPPGPAGDDGPRRVRGPGRRGRELPAAQPEPDAGAAPVGGAGDRAALRGRLRRRWWAAPRGPTGSGPSTR